MQFPQFPSLAGSFCLRPFQIGRRVIYGRVDVAEGGVIADPAGFHFQQIIGVVFPVFFRIFLPLAAADGIGVKETGTLFKPGTVAPAGTAGHGKLLQIPFLRPHKQGNAVICPGDHNGNIPAAHTDHTVGT